MVVWVDRGVLKPPKPATGGDMFLIGLIHPIIIACASYMYFHLLIDVSL